MSLEQIALFGLAACAVFLVVFIVLRRRPKKLKHSYFVSHWRSLQEHCRVRSNWPLALKEADVLLDNALKKRRYKGKTMGARLMAAQRDLSNNDGIWFAHNLTKKTIKMLDTQGTFKLAKADVKDALENYKNALADLGAIRRAK